jgi:hypothetical protein
MPVITDIRSFTACIHHIHMEKDRLNRGFMYALVMRQPILTSLRKELRINAFESVLPNYSRGTFGFEASVDSLQLCLGEPRGSAKGLQTVWAISRWRL